jgi:hypothetical protein
MARASCGPILQHIAVGLFLPRFGAAPDLGPEVYAGSWLKAGNAWQTSSAAGGSSSAKVSCDLRALEIFGIFLCPTLDRLLSMEIEFLAVTFCK